jgi:hypothetical protein
MVQVLGYVMLMVQFIISNAIIVETNLYSNTLHYETNFIIHTNANLLYDFNDSPNYAV